MDKNEKNRDRINLSEKVGEQEQRLLQSKHEKKRSVWAGLGLFGIIGWTIVVPTLSGIAFGRWLDVHYPQSHSWTLSLLVVGLALGCYGAWHWIKKEHHNMHQKNKP